MDTRTSLPFADGTYLFWLPMPRVIAAEREMSRRNSDGIKQPYSIFALFHEIGSHIGEIGDEQVLIGPSPALLSDAHAIIRNGLIGGGEGRAAGEDVAVTEVLASELVETYCYPARPAMHDLGLAWRILRAAIYGIDQGSKKKDGADADPSPS